MRTWIVTLIMIGSILVLAFSMHVPGSTPPDPFLPYADILSGEQMQAAIENRGFSCIDVFSWSHQTSCSFEPRDDFFFLINVTIVEQAIPQSVSFQVNRDTLRVGDLIALWGKPDTLFPQSAPTLLWLERDGMTISALVPSADRLNYLAPVWIVTFTF